MLLSFMLIDILRSCYHRRSIAASLVQGAYILERDRQENRQGPQALAPPWWDFFNFQLVRQLIDDADSSIFGAIYQYKHSPSDLIYHPANECPRFVIAFRGTINKLDTVSRDLNLDLNFIRNGLHRTSRFEIAMQAVQNLVCSVGSNGIWLTGHSLGSAMAMLAGKNMAKMGFFLETFLFNPPYVSAPIERIKDKKVKQGIRIATSVITAGLTLVINGQPRKNPVDGNHFEALAAWVPSLYVNPADHICAEYIGYFEHRSQMEKIGAAGIERLATQNSIAGLFLGASDPLHLIPSANLSVNLTPSPDFKRAHGIHQWWRNDLQLDSKLYMYK